MENIITEIKSSMEEINSRLDDIDESTKLEDIVVEISDEHKK